MYIRWISERFDAPAGRFPDLMLPMDVGCPRVDGDAFPVAPDEPAAALSFPAVDRDVADTLRPCPVFGGMMIRFAASYR
jgi:hypothetical protein